MEIKDPLYASSRAAWRAWLEAHHNNATEVWLLFYKKGSTTPSVTYPEAVEEALCYGWIDGIAKGMDGEKYAQRFTPRRKGSNWSAINTATAERLIREGTMSEAGLKVFQDRLMADKRKRPTRND